MPRRFFLKLLVFIMPISLYLFSTTSVLLYTGEIKPLPEIVQLQSGSAPVLYGRAYRDNYYSFKLVAAQTRQPEILALGSSRVMQFRSAFFNRHPSAFYNAGGAAQSIYEAAQYVNMLGEHTRLRVLIIALDEPWFNARNSGDPTTQRLSQQVDEENMPALDQALSVSPTLVSDFIKGKISLERVLSRTEPVHGAAAYGLNAIMNGNGFRDDGSYQYGGMILHPRTTTQRLEETFQRLKADTGQQRSGSAVSKDSLRELDQILTWARDEHVFVIGFIPPFAPSLYNAMMEDGQHTYIPLEAEKLRQRFADYGFAFFDYSTPVVVNGTDDLMLDGEHPSEYMCLLMYIDMLRELKGILGDYSDLDYLTRIATEKANAPFDVFGIGD